RPQRKSGDFRYTKLETALTAPPAGKPAGAAHVLRDQPNPIVCFLTHRRGRHVESHQTAWLRSRRTANTDGGAPRPPPTTDGDGAAAPQFTGDQGRPAARVALSTPQARRRRRGGALELHLLPGVGRDLRPGGSRSRSQSRFVPS